MTECTINFAPQHIVNEGGSNHKRNQEDQYVDFNVSESNEETSPDQFNCNRRVRNFIEVSDLLHQSLRRTSQQRVKKIIQLEGIKEFLSNDQMPVQATKCETTVIKVPYERLRNIIKVQDPQNIQNSQSKISNLLNTTHKVTEKNTPRSEHNEKNTPRPEHTLIHPPQKFRSSRSKIPLLITNDAIRNKSDQAAKKSTIEQGRGHSPLTTIEEGRGYSLLTKRQGGRGHSRQTKRQEGSGNNPLTIIAEGRGYSPQKDKGNLKSYPLRSRFAPKTEFWKK